MPTAAPPIKFDILAHDRTRAAFTSVQRRMRGLISSALRLTGVTSAGLIAASAVRDAVTFHSELTKIVNLAGVAEEQVAAWRAELLELAPALGQSPVDLARGLSSIASAGVPVERAMETLIASAKGSAIGLGETRTVADAATSAINAYAASNLSGSKAVAIMAAGVRAGKAEAEEMASSIGAAIPLASKLGISFDQVVASLAAMSRTGTTASEGATQLTSILAATLKPTVEAEEQLSKVGLTLGHLRDSLRNNGLLATLEELQKRFRGNEAAMARAFGNVRALRGVFTLLGENVDETRKIFDTLANESAVSLEKSFKDLQRLDPGFRMKQSIQELNKELIKTATYHLPAVAEAFAAVVRTFNEWSRHTVDPRSMGMAELNAEAEVLQQRMQTLAGLGGEIAVNSTGYQKLAERLAAVRLQMEKLVDMDVFGNGGIPTLPGADDGSRKPPPAGGGGFSDATQKVIDALEFEAEQLGRTAQAQDVYNQLHRAGVDINSIAGQRIAALTSNLYQARLEQENLNNVAGFTGATFVEVLDRASEKGANLADIWRDVAGAIKRAALEGVILGEGCIGPVFGLAVSSEGEENSERDQRHSAPRCRPLDYRRCAVHGRRHARHGRAEGSAACAS